MILFALFIPISLIAIAITLLIPCSQQIRIQLDGAFLNNFGLGFQLNDCQSIALEILLMSSILLLLSIGCFFVYLQLLRGISSRTHEQILPALILEIFSLTLLVFGELLSFDIEGLLEAIITGCISFYVCIVLYSLYVRFRDEKIEANVKVMYSKPEGISEDLLLV
ncbi:unnamed protein product [Chironomus riparius]|nr:unnamed protein product [Chironomus riparius]